VQRFSFLSLVRNALRYRPGWQRMWRNPDPKRRYDVVIIGGGGHGLGAAYYLAREHGIRNVAVLERGWLGGGNTARNTMTIRSNYIRPPSVPFHEGSMALYRELSRELNYNLMVGRRGMIAFLQGTAAARTAARMANTMHAYGARYELIDVEEIKRRVPAFRPPARPRLPLLGGVCQPDAMLARHDALAWGFARMADALGVDIIQNCEVTGIRRDGNRVTGVDTNRGRIDAGKVGMAVAGHGSVVAEMADTVVVMYWGRVVEQASVRTIFREPKHPYTAGLQRSLPKLGDVKKARLNSIKGVVPDPFASLQGCPYHPRCPEAIKGVCDEGDPPALVEIEREHQVACFLYHEERVETA